MNGLTVTLTKKTKVTLLRYLVEESAKIADGRRKTTKEERIQLEVMRRNGIFVVLSNSIPFALGKRKKNQIKKLIF